MYGSRSWPVMMCYKSFENVEITEYSRTRGIGKYTTNAAS